MFFFNFQMIAVLHLWSIHCVLKVKATVHSNSIFMRSSYIIVLFLVFYKNDCFRRKPSNYTGWPKKLAHFCTH